MSFTLPLILFCNTATLVGLIFIHHWLAYAVAGICLGFIAAVYYILGHVHQTIEFWKGTGPRWMRRIFGVPGRLSFISFSKGYKVNIGKLGKAESIFFGVSGTLFLIFFSMHNSLYIGMTVIFLITWLVSVFFTERYFRKMYSQHRFTRIREDSEI